MPLTDKEVLRLVRKLVSWARRLRDASICRCCGVQQSAVAASCPPMRCFSSERWKKAKLKYESKGPQKHISLQDIRLLVLQCSQGVYRSKTREYLHTRTHNPAQSAEKVVTSLACRILTSQNPERSISLLCRMAADSNRYSYLAKTLLIKIISILSTFPSQRREVTGMCSHCDSRSRRLFRKCHHSDYFRRYCRICCRGLRRFSIQRATSSESNITDEEDQSEKTILPLQLKPDYLPILVGTISVPMMPCPILISKGAMTAMLRRLLLRDEKILGMALPASQYGTILQICDCIELRDGSFILTTLGRGRFRIIKRVIIQHCLVAKVKMVYDHAPIDSNLHLNPYIEVTGKRIIKLFDNFFLKLKPEVKNNILNSYGPLQKYLVDRSDCENGPAYLWWMTAVLPLSDELKVHLISCEFIHKRMAIIQDALIKAAVIYEDINSMDQDIMT